MFYTGVNVRHTLHKLIT